MAGAPLLVDCYAVWLEAIPPPQLKQCYATAFVSQLASLQFILLYHSLVAPALRQCRPAHKKETSSYVITPALVFLKAGKKIDLIEENLLSCRGYHIVQIFGDYIHIRSTGMWVQHTHSDLRVVTECRSRGSGVQGSAVGNRGKG